MVFLMQRKKQTWAVWKTSVCNLPWKSLMLNSMADLRGFSVTSNWERCRKSLMRMMFHDTLGGFFVRNVQMNENCWGNPCGKMFLK